MSFWELIIAYPNGGQWAPFSYVSPLAQTSSYASSREPGIERSRSFLCLLLYSPLEKCPFYQSSVSHS